MSNAPDAEPTPDEPARAGAGRTFSWLFVGRVVAAAAQALLLGFVALDSTPSEFGLLAGTTGFAVAAVAWFDLGLSTYIVRERAIDQASPRASRAISISRAQSVVFAILGALALIGLGYLLNPVFFALVPLSAWATLERQADILMSLRLADGHPSASSLNIVSRRFIALIIYAVLTVAFDLHGVESYVAAVTVAALVSFLTATWATRDAVPRAVGITWAEVLRESRFFWLNSAATQTRNLDTAVVAALASPTVAGIFAVASRLTSPLRMFPTAMASALLPLISRAHARGESLRRPAVLSAWTVAATAAAAGAGIIVIPSVLSILGPEYAGSVLATQIVIGSLPLAALTSLLSSFMQGQGRTRIVGYSAAISSFAALLFAGLGAAAAGASGGAAGIAASFALNALILLIALATQRRKNRDNE